MLCYRVATWAIASFIVARTAPALKIDTLSEFVYIHTLFNKVNVTHFIHNHTAGTVMSSPPETIETLQLSCLQYRNQCGL